MRTLMALIMTLSLVACSGGDSSGAGEPPLAKQWTRTYSGVTYTWDWSAFRENTTFSAPFHFNAEICSCTVTASGPSTGDNMSVDCTWVPSAGTDPGCDANDDFVHYESVGTNGLIICANWGHCDAYL